jgi:hypothetical protein
MAKRVFMAATVLVLLAMPAVARPALPSNPSVLGRIAECTREQREELENGNAFDKGFAKGYCGPKSEGQPEPPPRSTPPPKPKSKAAAKTTIRVSATGCRYLPHIWVNGQKNVGGDIAWALYQWKTHRWVRLAGETSEVSARFTAGDGERGQYRFVGRFLGDANLYPTPHPASATFFIRARNC